MSAINTSEKSILIKITLLFAAALLVSNSFAQTKIDSGNYVQPFSKISSFRTWSIALNGGLLVPFNEDFYSANYKEPGFGITIKDQLLPSFGIQADIFAGQAQGLNSRDGGTYSSYLTKLASASLSINITLANISWGRKKGVIQPYFTAGLGYMGYQPQLTTTDASGTKTSALYTTKQNGIRQSTVVPVGAGFIINLSKSINLDLGYTVSFVNADDFDGFIYGTRNDEFSYMHIGLEFALGSHKKPQLGTHNPINSMRTEYLMIEHSLNIQLNAQKTQIDQLKIDLAAKTAFIDTAHANLLHVTTDSDGDGVADLYDKCPNTPVSTVVDGSGCPIINKPAPLAQPAPSAQPARSAQPAPSVQPAEVKVIVNEQDNKVVKEAFDNMQFDFSKIAIRGLSFETLDRLANLLKEKNLSLKLSGYTDNVGPDGVNVRLSKDRAEAIRNYLISKGANGSKIEAKGYGRENPIAPNNTVEGRKKNRRVEFSVF